MVFNKINEHFNMNIEPNRAAQRVLRRVMFMITALFGIMVALYWVTSGFIDWLG